MRTNHRTGLMIASLAVALLATLAVVPSAQAGPISDMIARHRQAKAMKLPPMTKPHTIVPIKDPNARTASLSQRFKQRFSLKRNSNQDQGVVRTSR
jgi:hypothetical protein